MPAGEKVSRGDYPEECWRHATYARFWKEYGLTPLDLEDADPIWVERMEKVLHAQQFALDYKRAQHEANLEAAQMMADARAKGGRR